MARSSSTSADLSGERPGGETPLVEAALTTAPKRRRTRESQIQTTTESGGKLPPQNLSAERSLLGSILIDDEALVDVADKIAANDFYDRKHRQIFGAMVKLYQKHSPIDMLTVSNELKSQDILDEAGGVEYLSDLTNYVPSAAHAVEYARIVREAAVRRNLTKAGEKIADLAYKTDEDVESILSQAEADLY